MELPNADIVEPLYRETRLDQVRSSAGMRHPLAAFARKTPLKEICSEISRSPDLLRQVARTSYRHPNGFDIIGIWRDHDDARIKLDVWWENDTDWGWIHNHRFDFSSYVIEGALQSRHYLATEPTDENGVDVYRLSAPQRSDEIIPTRKGILLAWEGSIPAGGSYDIDCNMFHQATGTEGMVTVTLVAQRAAKRAYSEVVSEQPFVLERAGASAIDKTASSAPRVKLDYFSEDQLRSKLERLASL